MIRIRNQSSHFDQWLLISTIILVTVGLLAIYDASVVSAFRDFHDRLFYFKNQLIWASLGSISLFFFSLFDYHRLLKLSHFILAASILMLILVLVPFIGTQVLGARRWISVGTFTFQPSEFTKLALIFYETSIISKLAKYKTSLIDFAIVLFLPALFTSVLVLVQPDLGTALIFLVLTLIIYFIGGGPVRHFFLAIPLLIAMAVAAIISQPYRLARLESFLDPTRDPQGASYQISQIIIALSSGKLFGVGIGGSRGKFDFIPEVHSDSIFAVIVEELGFIGGVVLILIFLFLITRGIKIARSAPDLQGKILAMGIVTLIATQSLFNLASNVALVPLTGVPLPFISYGGSSLFVTLTAIGILLNVKSQS